MLFLRRPTAEAIRAFLASQARLDLTYSTVGATAANPPAGYVVDHTRMRLGAGEKVFATAKAALEGWQQFRLGWLEASPEDTPIKEGHVVAILARSIGLWWLNACRMVIVVDEGASTVADWPVSRFENRSTSPSKRRRISSTVDFIAHSWHLSAFGGTSTPWSPESPCMNSLRQTRLPGCPL
jgi:Domain of unknown function (DUF1990)